MCVRARVCVRVHVPSVMEVRPVQVGCLPLTLATCGPELASADWKIIIFLLNVSTDHIYFNV